MTFFKSAGADFSAGNLGRVIQLTTLRDQLKGEFIFGRNAKTTTLNSAYAGAPPAFVVGAPVYADHRINNVDFQNYLDTTILDNVDITVAVVVAPGATASFDTYMSTGPAAGKQLALYCAANITFQAVNAASSPTGLLAQVSTPTTPLTDFRMIAGRMSGAVNPTIKLDEYKNGIHTQSAAVTGSATRVVDTRSLAVGSLKAAGFAGVMDFSAALIWHKMLSDSEMLQAYLETQAVLREMGITI